MGDLLDVRVQWKYSGEKQELITADLPNPGQQYRHDTRLPRLAHSELAWVVRLVDGAKLSYSLPYSSTNKWELPVGFFVVVVLL